MDENNTAPGGQKQTHKERIKAITDSIEAGIQELYDSEKYKNYLRTMSRFHHYSANNIMLIHMQSPNATHVAGFSKWQNTFGRSVKKGEKGIKILAPTFFKKKVEEMKLDPDTKAPMVDKNGEVILEEKEVKIPMYKVVHVYDVAQTVGKPLPQLAATLTGDVKQYDIFMEALKRSSPVPMEIKAIAPNMDGYFSAKEQNIVIREGMSEVQTICAAVHEIAHSKLHNKDAISDEKYYSVDVFGKPALFTEGRIDRSTLPDGLFAYDTRSENGFGDPVTVEDRVAVNFAGTIIVGEKIVLPEEGYLSLVENEDDFYGNGVELSVKEFWEQVCPEKAHKSERTQEVEAESIAYAVCTYYGIETGDNSFGYIASWSSDHDLKELKASLETINATASGLITDIDRNFNAICKERGIDRSEKEGEPLAQEALFLLDDSVYLHVQRRSEDYDYDFSLYSADSLKLIDGGVTELPEDSTLIDAPLITVAQELLGDYGIAYAEMEPVALNKLQEIEEANAVVPPVEVMPEPLRALDEYPMPDTSVPADALVAVGYAEDDLLPVSREKAHELLDMEFSVYFVDADGEPLACFEHEEIDEAAPDAVGAILRDEWEESPQFRDRIDDRLGQQDSREAAFFAYPRDCFAIYQLDATPEARDRAFMGADWLEKQGLSPDRRMYDLKYTAELGTKSLEDIFYEFNMERPADFGGPSLSVSDVVAINHGGEISYHFCDRLGFKELHSFLPENPLKNAEMSMEDDYNMLDGIVNNGVKQPTVDELEQQARSGQAISLMDLADAIQREKKPEAPKKAEDIKPKRMSIYERLRQPVPQQAAKKTAPKKSAEMEH